MFKKILMNHWGGCFVKKKKGGRLFCIVWLTREEILQKPVGIQEMGTVDFFFNSFLSCYQIQYDILIQSSKVMW